jgi:hypothetical protein
MSRTHAINQPTRYRGNVEEAEGLPRNAVRHITEGVRFEYVHYPSAWEYIADATLEELGVTREEVGLAENGWLPVLSMIKRVPGAGAVSNNGSMTTARANAIEKGGTVISPQDPRLGPFTDYMAWYDVQGGGKYFVAWCERVDAVMPNGHLVWDTATAAVEMLKFRVRLRDHVLPKPTRAFPLAIIEREADQLKRYQEMSGGSPQWAERAKQHAARVASMREDLDKWLGKAKSKPLEFAAESPRSPQAERGAPPKQKRGSLPEGA